MNKNANNSNYFIIEFSCRKPLTFYNNTSWSWKKLEELIANAELSILLHNFRLASCLGETTNIKLFLLREPVDRLTGQQVSKSCKKNCLSLKKIHVGKLEGAQHVGQ